MNTHPTISETQALIEDALCHGARPVMPEALAYALAHPDEGRPAYETLAQEIGRHLIAAIKGLSDIQTDKGSLTELMSVLEAVRPHADELPGSDAYLAILSLDKWADVQLAECDYRRQNAVE